MLILEEPWASQPADFVKTKPHGIGDRLFCAYSCNDINNGAVLRSAAAAGAPFSLSNVTRSRSSRGGIATFNGTTSYGAQAAAGNLAFDNASKFSATAWLYLDRDSISDQGGAIFSNLTPASGYVGWEMSARVEAAISTYLGLQFFLINSYPTNAIHVKTTASSFPTRTWTFLGITYNGGSSASSVGLYVNGEPLATTAISDTLSSTTVSATALQLGRRSDNTDLLAGSVQHVNIWNRALSASEMRDVYRNAFAIYAPRRIYIPTAAAAGGLPTLSASTYKPGTLTSSGWTARVTAS